MRPLLGIMNPSGEGSHSHFERSRRFQPHLVYRVEEKPSFLRAVQPAFESLLCAHFERISEISVDIFDPDKESSTPSGHQPFSFGLELERLTRTRIGEDYRPRLALQVAPIDPRPSSIQQPSLIQIHVTAAGGAGNLREVSYQRNGAIHDRSPTPTGYSRGNQRSTTSAGNPNLSGARLLSATNMPLFTSAEVTFLAARSS